MNEQMKKDYDSLLSFWNGAFALTEEERKQTEEEVDPGDGGRSLAPSQKLWNAARSLGSRRCVLDYGCGSGWAGIAAAKAGCRHVVCADTATNGIEAARLYGRLMGTENAIEYVHIPADWLSRQPEGRYDGLICSNVLDVIPTEAAEEILRHAARAVTADADVIIGLNHYMEPKEDAERHITLQHGNHIYVNGILRLVSRTDAEWEELLERYFAVIRLEHFAWPGETAERRRLFFLRKKP